MTAHTPTPWDCDTDDLGTWINSPAFPQPIAKMGKCTAFPTQANAAFIVRAVNAHDDMLAALSDAEDCIDAISPQFEAFGKGGQKTLDIIRAAIAKAKAEGRAS